MRSKTALQIAALLVIVLTNAVALGGAWWNRSGEAESRLDLSERELKMPFSGFDRESSGLAFALAWRVGVAAEAGEANLDWDENRSARWLDRAKMESLGFDLSDVSEHPRLRRHELARDVLLVLEFDGMAYRRALERARQRRVTEEAKLAAMPAAKDKENRLRYIENELAREENESSRLFVVDAGLDLAALRGKYPDRSRHAIVRGQVRPMWSGRQNDSDSARGYVSNLSVSTISVPHALYPLLSGSGEQKTFLATVAFGRRLEPWVEQIRVPGR